MATADVNAARRSYMYNAIAMVSVSLLLCALGLALLGYYTQVPGALGEGMTIAKDADKLFPHFIANHLPVGLAGLVVSAAIAAAMSSVDSGVNSITAVATSDFLPRLGWKPSSERSTMLFTKGLAFAIGAVVVVASMFMQNVPGNFIGMTSRTANLVVVPLFVLFVMALWVPRATPVAAWLGAAYGLTTATFIAFWDGLTGGEVVSFQWMGAGALVANLVVGLGLSFWGPRRENVKGSRLAGAIGAGVLLGVIVVLMN
jgi:SSS family solute:Na+ symporter